MPTLSCQCEFIFSRLLTLEVENATWTLHNPQVSINDKTAAGSNEIAQGRCLNLNPKRCLSAPFQFLFVSSPAEIKKVKSQTEDVLSCQYTRNTHIHSSQESSLLVWTFLRYHKASRGLMMEMKMWCKCSCSAWQKLMRYNTYHYHIPEFCKKRTLNKTYMNVEHCKLLLAIF